VALIATAAFLLWRSRGREPKSWALEESRLVVRDKDGRVCWAKSLPQFDTKLERARDQALIADIDGDGHAEVLFNLVPLFAGQQGGSLLCFESDGRLRWEFRFSGVRRFGERVFEPNYRGRFMRLPKVRGETRILTVAKHFLWYPAQVALLAWISSRLARESEPRLSSRRMRGGQVRVCSSAL